ncbi:hypothetical protein [Flavobacterium pedocola]
MLKNISTLEGAQLLTKSEQKEISGGKLPPPPACQVGGYQTTLNQCVCRNGGVWQSATQTCSNGQYTGWVWENATGCCYNFSGE